MKAKRAAMRSAEAYARTAHHCLGPWKHKGQTAVASCTNTDPIRNKGGKMIDHHHCDLVVVIKRQPGAPSDTEPHYHNVRVFHDKDGNINSITACVIGKAAANRGHAYRARLRKKRTPGSAAKPTPWPLVKKEKSV